MSMNACHLVILVFLIFSIIIHTHGARIVEEPPFVRSGISRDGTHVEENVTVSVGVSGIVSSFGESIVIPLKTPLQQRVGMKVTFYPKRHVFRVTKRMLLLSELDVMGYKTCTSVGQALFNESGHVQVPNALLDTPANESVLYNAFLQPRDPAAYASAYDPLSPTPFDPEPGISNKGRTLLSVEDGPCLPQTTFPCTDVCIMQVTESHAHCAARMQAYYNDLPLPKPALHTPLQHNTTSISTYLGYVIAQNPNAQLVDLANYYHSVPNATCVAPAYDVARYLRENTTFLFPNTEAASCTPWTLDAFPQTQDCIDLVGQGSGAAFDTCMATRLIDLSFSYSDTDLFYGTDAGSAMFRRYLRNALVNMTDTCGLNFRTRDRPITEAALYTTDYFEPSGATPCACTLRQFSQFQRSCVLNPWDITGPNGEIPIWPQVTKCQRTRGLWTCAPFLRPEITRVLTVTDQYKACDNSPVRGPCGKKAALLNTDQVAAGIGWGGHVDNLQGQLDGLNASCDDTVDTLFAGQWQTQNATLNSDLQVTDPSQIQATGGDQVQQFSISGTKIFSSDEAETAYCGMKAMVGAHCDCNKYVIQYRDDRPRVAVQDAVNSYALLRQSQALTAYQQGLANLSDAISAQQQIGYGLLRTFGETQSTILAADIATANVAKILATDSAKVSAHAQQLELLTRRWSELITTKYNVLQARTDGLEALFEETRNSLGDELVACEKQIALMQVSLQQKRRVMEKVHLLDSASRQMQQQFQEQVSELVTERQALRRLVRGGTDSMRRTKAETNLNPLVVGGVDALGNYGFQGRPLLSNERIWSIEMSRVWYLAPTFLQHIPTTTSDLALQARIRTVIQALMNTNPDDVGGDVFLALNFTSPQEDEVQQYLNTSFETVDVHQLTMQLQCDAVALIDFHQFEVTTDTLRDWIGPDGCILGSHVESRQCRCRIRLIHRLCTHIGTPHEASSIIQSAGWPRHLALDSSTVAATGICSGNAVHVRVPIWNPAGPASTLPVDSGRLKEMDRFWLDTCLGLGNDPSVFDHAAVNSTLSDVIALEDLTPTNGLVATLPCATKVNDTLFANDTDDPCLGVRAPLQLQHSNDPLVVGASLETHMPIFNHTGLGGFLVYSDGMGQITIGNGSVAFDPDHCSANLFQNVLYMSDRADGKVFLYYMIQRLAADALLTALRSPQLRQLEYIQQGMWPIGVATTYSAIAQTPSRKPPINPEGVLAQPDISMTTGLLETNPVNLVRDLELRNQTRDTDYPLLWTKQGIEKIANTLPLQRRDCYGLTYLAGTNFSIPVSELEYITEHDHVTLEFVFLETNATLSNMTLATQILNQIFGITKRDFVDRTIRTSVSSEATTLLQEPGNNLLFFGFWSALLGLPVNYAPKNATEQRQKLHPAVAHHVNGTKLPPPVPSRNPVLSVDPQTFEVTTHEQRTYYVFDPSAEAMRGMYNERKPGNLGYYSLQWPTVIRNDSGFETRLGGGANGLQPIDVPSVAQPQDWNAYARMPMFPPEEYFAQRGYDFSIPTSLWNGWNPEGGITNPGAFLTLLREIRSTDPGNSSRSTRWLQCASKVSSEFGRWCQILEKFRVVDTFEEPLTAQDLGLNLNAVDIRELLSGAQDPNPENRGIAVLEATNDDQASVVTISLPSGLLADLVIQSQPCPSSLSMNNAFRPNTTIQMLRPLEAGDMLFRLDIQSQDTEDSCDGSQTIVVTGYGGQNLSDVDGLLQTRFVSIPLFDCRPLSVNLTRLNAGPHGDMALVCWNWTAAATDLTLTPASDTLDIVFEEQRNTRSLFIAAATILFTNITGEYNNLVVDQFLSQADFQDQVTQGNIVFPGRGDTWLPLTQLPGINPNTTLFFNGTLDVESNYTYGALTGGRPFFNVTDTNTNITQLQTDLSRIYNDSLSNSSALVALIDSVNNQSQALLEELQRRMTMLENLSDLARRIGSLNITTAELSQTLQNLVDEARNLTVNFQATIDILLSEGFRNITEDAWICLRLLGNTQIITDPVAAGNKEKAMRELLRIRKSIFDSLNEDCKGWANFECGDRAWIRAVVWFTVFYIAFISLYSGIYLGLIKSEACGSAPKGLVADGFGREPPRPSYLRPKLRSRSKSRSKSRTRSTEQQNKRDSDTEPMEETSDI